MKVLIVATSFSTKGGISSVIKAHQAGLQWEELHCKWLETHIDKGSIFKLYYFLKAVIQYLFLMPAYDLVHIHTSEPSSALRKVFFLWYAKLFGKKVIIHFHAFSIETTINSKFRQVYQFLFSSADVVIVLSEYWRTEIIQTFKLSHKIKILYNPCASPDTTIFYSRQKNILYAGSINDRKGYKDLLIAFSKVAKDFPDWKIVFAGCGEIEKAKKISIELDIDDQCLFLGWISGQSKDKVFKEASIFCLPSYAEGFPMAVLDAWAYSIPVISTPVGGLIDIVSDDKNILLFNPGDIDMLSKQLKRLIRDSKLYSILKQESIKLASETFNLESVNNELRHLYLNLYKNKIC